MTPREKRLLAFLVALAVFGVLAGFYWLVYSPWQSSRGLATKLEEELSDKHLTLAELEGKAKKLKTYHNRSLPGDPGVARREYEAMLDLLIQETKAPASRTYKELSDANRVPTLAPKTPAYTRIGYEIVFRKVDLPTVIRFLEAYYKRPVLQQITRLSIKKAASEVGDGSSKGGGRGDLEVTIATEGVIVHGAEKRETIQPVNALAALGGSLGLGLMQNSVQGMNAIRAFVPASLPSALAPGRDYAALIAKDPFHGPLPEPPPPPKKPETPVAAPPKPKEDISPYIRLTGITWRSDGTVSAEIRDTANNLDYEVSRKIGLDGDMRIAVKKYFYLEGKRKPLDGWEDLVIAEDGTATDRQFKVLDFTGEGLILSERSVSGPDDNPEETTIKSSGRNPGGKSVKKSSVGVKGPQPLGATVGGAAFAPSPPGVKLFLWRIGATLDKLELLSNEKTTEVSPMPRAER